MTATADTPAPDQIEAVRGFNRFITNIIGALEETLTRSSFTLAEARVLYELGADPDPSAAGIARALTLDPAYLARILRRFREKGLLRASRDRVDGRRRSLVLTEKGQSAREDLQQAARAATGGLLAPLAPAERARLVSAMAEIERILGAGGHDGPEVAIRNHRTGDVGWVVHRQAVLYAQEYGWDIGFEALLAEIGGDFIRDFRPGRDGCWIAERGEDVLGAVFLVEESGTVGKLRMLYVEPEARGLGIGRRLVAECIAGARRAGYDKLVLWTNDILTSARRIYQEAGFELVSEEPHHSFGKHLVGQYWELEL